MTSQEMTLLLEFLVPAVLVVLLVGMFLSFLIVRLLVKSRMQQRMEQLPKKKRKNSSSPYNPADFEELIHRCSDLSQRLRVLEEIMAEERAGAPRS